MSSSTRTMTATLSPLADCFPLAALALADPQPGKHSNSHSHRLSPSREMILIRASPTGDLKVPTKTETETETRKTSFVQLSGHEHCFIVPTRPGTIWKLRAPDDRELKAYERLAGDEMADMVPRFHGEVAHGGKEYIEIGDLLFPFERHSLSVMDIKMGTRTFLESEVTNIPTPREDLFHKMVALDPSAPTPHERAARAVTKLRYMQTREALSSSSTLGFRVEGYSMEGGEPQKDLKLVRERGEVAAIIERFLCRATAAQWRLIMDRLRAMRSQFERSAFFREHEIVGSSLLLIWDAAGRAGVWMIDFARTHPTPHPLTHRSPWQLGNHEDGLLTGMDNLIAIVEQLAENHKNLTNGLE